LATKTDITRSQHLYHKLESEIILSSKYVIMLVWDRML